MAAATIPIAASSPGGSLSNAVNATTGIMVTAANPVGVAGQIKTQQVISATQLESGQVLNKQRLQDLVREVDPNEQLDDDVEDMLLQIADDFIENVVTTSCMLAKHRKANTLEVKDVQFNLEKNWNIWIPGFGSDELRPYKKAAPTEAHKQRLALIRKTLKKY